MTETEQAEAIIRAALHDLGITAAPHIHCRHCAKRVAEGAETWAVNKLHSRAVKVALKHAPQVALDVLRLADELEKARDNTELREARAELDSLRRRVASMARSILEVAE